MTPLISRRAFLRFTGIGLLTLAFPTLLLADSKDEAKALIQSVYNEWNAAIKARDLKAFAKNHAPDFVHVDRKGKKRTLKDSLAELKTLLPRLDTREAETKIESITLNNDTATVEIAEKATLFLKKPDGTSSKMEIETFGRDFWVKRGGKWVLKQSRTTEETARMDGREVPT